MVTGVRPTQSDGESGRVNQIERDNAVQVKCQRR
jgi:hypothetical protein